MNSDIFDALVNSVGCEYISDLRFGANNLKARKFLAETDLSIYPLAALSDVAAYIFGKKIKFSSLDEAQKFFKS